MKKLLLLFCFLNISLFAQTFENEEASKLIPNAKKVILNKDRNSIAYVSFKNEIDYNESTTNDWLTKILKTDEQTSFKLFQTETDKSGFIHYRFKQYYKNLLVKNGVYYVHTKNNKIESINGELYTNINLDVTPQINSNTATQNALLKLNSKKLATNKKTNNPELVVYRDSIKTFHLAWKIDLYSEEPLARNNYYVDAKTGKIVGVEKRIHNTDVTATAHTKYSGVRTITTDLVSTNNYRLQESGRGGGIFTYDENFNEITNNSTTWNFTDDIYNYALDAHWGAEVTFDYFENKFNRIGQDGFGMPVTSSVMQSAYVNAYWDGSMIVYGAGDFTNYNPLTSLDIVGHEYTHSVTEFSAGLIYSGESGALNESFSDVFGAAINFHNNPSTATWLVGYGLAITSGNGAPFRSMNNPNLYDCADTYGGLYFNNGDIVHYDSGIQNYWFYLLVNGGNGTNDIENNFNVSAIGMDEAIEIAYRNLTVYLTPSSNFEDARNYAEQSALDLFGNCSNQYIQTQNAWYAVGVGNFSNNSVYANFKANPKITCSTPSTINFVNLSGNASNYLWDFGDGNTSNLTNPTHTYLNTGTYTVTLVSTGTVNCPGNTSDTEIKNNYLVVNNFPGTISPSCSPQTVAYCCGKGITNVKLNTIDYTSDDASYGYSDFTCADSTLLIAGSSYQMSVTTSINEKVNVWIDYNNDGSFNNTNELIFQDNNSTLLHTDIINTAISATLNTRLRMRVISDENTYNINDACYAPQKGQVEDFMVYFIENTQVPIADFTTDKTIINIGESINFQDFSMYSPTSWTWSFPGAVTTYSNLQNPTNITYNNPGTYTVSLTTNNAFGTDTQTKINYIIVKGFNMCGATTESIDLNGSLYFSGDNSLTDCSFLISPPCGHVLTLTFEEINIEYSGWIYIYDGDSNLDASPFMIIGNPSINMPEYVSKSGKFLIEFRHHAEDDLNNIPYFRANWTTEPIVGDPYVNFKADFKNSCSTPLKVKFTNQSEGSSSFIWDFGDGSTSTLTNPVHTYTSYNNYNVALTALGGINCLNATTFTKNNYINIVSDNKAPQAASCYPSYSNVSWNYKGITEVKLDSIDAHSDGAMDGFYKDYSCFYNTTLKKGVIYTLQVKTASIFEDQDVSAWIDFNDNGIFENATEQILKDTSLFTLTHMTTFTVQSNARINKPLRMRFFSGTIYSFSNNACVFDYASQIQDYKVIIEDLTSTIENSLEKISIFPNPTNGLFTLDLGTASLKSNIKVSNAIGQNVIQINNHIEKNIDIDLSNYANGVYFVEVETNNSVERFKIIKN